MTPERLRQLAACLYDGWGPGDHPDELSAWLADVATAMEAPLEVFELDAKPRKSGEGVVKLRGPAGNVVKAGQRGVLYRKVAIVPIGVRRLAEPVACSGARGLWDVPDDIADAVRERIAA